MLWAACFSLMLTFVYNFNKTPWFPLMWMVRFVTFVHKDLFPDKYLWSSTWEIHLKILQPTPWEPVSIVEVVNKSERQRKTSSPQHSRCSYASGELTRINFHSIKRGVILTFHTFCSNKKPEAKPRAFHSQNV